MLIAALKDTRPDAVITELFPFGRRVLAEEFAALIEAARAMRPRPLVLCSVRDILVAPTRTDWIADAHERLARDYDAILAHGDPRLVALEESWPVDDRLRPLIHYTGYVDENPAPAIEGGRRGIVVSGGSSAASVPLYHAAVEATHAIPEHPWQILVGRGVAESDFEILRAKAPVHATVERARPDFRPLLSRAALSISQAGYNTVVDILRSRVKSVLVPFEAGRETEQRLRAERLGACGLATVLPESELSPEAVADTVRQALTSPVPLPHHNSLDGARRSVSLVEGLAISRPALWQTIDWSPLSVALERAEDAGCPVAFWWRDDDAVAHTPQLDRLLHLARRFGAGLALAAIPQAVEASLADRLNAEPTAFALVHGWRHANNAPPGEKKAEFGAHRATAALAGDAEQAIIAAKRALGVKLLPVFVPPWNRIAADLIPLLPRLGYEAVSTFRDRKAEYGAPGLLQLNTHIDPIDWRGTRSLIEPTAIVSGLAKAVERRISDEADRGEPIGLLTHHLVHDEAVWSFCENLAEYLARWKRSFLRPDQLFRNDNRIVVGI